MTDGLRRFDRPWPETTFSIVPPAHAAIPVVAHVPHAATLLPAPAREEIIVDDAELELELIRVTDWHTDDLFDWLGRRGATMFVNRLSRFVFDPERFLDKKDEPTTAKGQGVIYTHGTQGQRLRDDSATLRAQRVEALYRPYHAALDGLAGAMLESLGTCTLIDCHSFPSVAMPSELDQAPDRPEICIGTDATHTPLEMASSLSAAFAAEGFLVELDRPFAGTLVPSAFYQHDSRVRSVMIEVRRDLYMDETTAERSPGYRDTKRAIERAVLRSGAIS